MSVNITDVVVTTASGAPQRLGDLAGQVLLVVNVASRCGFTAQYEGLQKLQETFADRGFSVLAFPCNDFGGQEPGELEESKPSAARSTASPFRFTPRFTPAEPPRPLMTP